MSESASEHHLLIEQDMTEPLAIAMPEGEAVVFSCRKPDAERANQDGALVLALDTGHGLLAVADGMGGMPGGGHASGTALRTLADRVRASARSAEERGDLRAPILDAIEHANEEIGALGVGAGTTLAIVETTASTLRPYHVGDSTILVVGQRGKVKLQSVSHSPTGYAVEAGFLDEDEALLHDERHVVSNVVGGEGMHIEVGSTITLAPRDTLLIASDGLTDNLTPAETVALIRKGPLADAARDLAAACQRRMGPGEDGAPGKPDDLTFVLYRQRR